IPHRRSRSRTSGRGLAHGTDALQSPPNALAKPLFDQGHRQMLGHRQGTSSGRCASWYGDQHMARTKEPGKRRIVGNLLADADCILEHEMSIAGLEEGSELS